MALSADEVSGLYNAPTAVADDVTVARDTAVTIDVLANDGDPQSDPLTIASVTQASNGTVVNNGSDVTYTPNLGFGGVDSFTYTISDGNNGEATATVIVTLSNEAPTAVDDSATIDEEPVVIIDVLANDTDPDGDTLTIESVGQATNGSVTNRATDVTYTPNPGFTGTDTFTYTINDGYDGVASATVTVTLPNERVERGQNDVPFFVTHAPF